MYIQSGELVIISKGKFKFKIKFLKSLRFRIALLACMAWLIPAYILYHGMLASYEARAVSLRTSEIQNQCTILSNHLNTYQYLEDPSSELINSELTQLTNIYNGAITNWSEIGGTDTPIVVVGREAGSGTRGAFEELLELEDACAYANELDSTGAVMAKVASTPGAIGYVSLDVLDDTVVALDLEGVAATAENIKAGNYFLSRPFVMATKGAISEQSELVQAWFDFVMGEEGQEIAAEVGLITVQ